MKNLKSIALRAALLGVVCGGFSSEVLGTGYVSYMDMDQAVSAVTSLAASAPKTIEPGCTSHVNMDGRGAAVTWHAGSNITLSGRSKLTTTHVSGANAVTINAMTFYLNGDENEVTLHSLSTNPVAFTNALWENNGKKNILYVRGSATPPTAALQDQNLKLVVQSNVFTATAAVLCNITLTRPMSLANAVTWGSKTTKSTIKLNGDVLLPSGAVATFYGDFAGNGKLVVNDTTAANALFYSSTIPVLSLGTTTTNACSLLGKQTTIGVLETFALDYSITATTDKSVITIKTLTAGDATAIGVTGPTSGSSTFFIPKNTKKYFSVAAGNVIFEEK